MLPYRPQTISHPSSVSARQEFDTTAQRLRSPERFSENALVENIGELYASAHGVLPNHRDFELLRRLDQYAKMLSPAHASLVHSYVQAITNLLEANRGQSVSQTPSHKFYTSDLVC